MDFDVIMCVLLCEVMFSADSRNMVWIGERKKNDRKIKQMEKFTNINDVNGFCFACNEEDSLHYLYTYSFSDVGPNTHSIKSKSNLRRFRIVLLCIANI